MGLHGADSASMIFSAYLFSSLGKMPIYQSFPNRKFCSPPLNGTILSSGRLAVKTCLFVKSNLFGTYRSCEKVVPLLATFALLSFGQICKLSRPTPLIRSVHSGNESKTVKTKR